jgi:hypothetical protein
MATLIDEIWDSSSNREAEGQTPWRGSKKDINISESFYEEALDDSTEPGDVTKGPEQIDGMADALPLTDEQFMALARSAYRQGVSYQQKTLQPRWNRAYNAWNNQHNSDSKYSSARFRGRSRLYRPKTRATARKKDAEAAAALFSTSEAVIVSAQNQSDPMMQASAQVIQELLNFRLDRSNENAGIPWFMISMGAHLTSQQTGVCISKQYWEYRTVTEMVEQTTMIQEPVTHPLLPQVILGMQDVPVTTMVPREKTVRDRPRVQLIPPEDCIRDPAAAWEDQAQDSSYLILRFPMPLTEARAFLKQDNDKSAVKFRPVDDSVLMASAGTSKGDSSGAASTRRARDQDGNDRYNEENVDREFQTVWLHETFLRIENKDYVFWTLEDRTLVSDIVPVEKAYPEQGGARPVTIGVASLEPFKTDPMAPLEAWQPLQQEINDIVNLRLDTLKQTIAPLAKVKRGRSVDVKAVQNRSPDTIVYLQAMDDLEFDRPGDVSGSAYAEMEKLNADFDDQAGNFSLGSVQTNRQLGETVGGMQMMSSNANALGEFDLRVWIETWVEPCLRQLVKLEQYYESDQNVIAVAGERAKVMQKFGIDEITDEMLTSQVTLTVNVGIGAADPLLSLDKFAKATQIAGGILGPAIQQRIKQDEVIDEVFGKAGYKNASERFFLPMPEEDPRLMEAQQVVQQMQGALQEAEAQLQKNKEGQAFDAQQAEADRQHKAQIAAEDRKSQEKIARMATLKDLAKQEMTNRHQAQQSQMQAAETARLAQEQQANEAMQAEQEEMEEPEAPEGSEDQALLEGLQQLASSLVDAIMQGNSALAQGIQQGNATLAQGMEQNNAQVIEAIQQSGQMQAQTTAQIAEAIAKPKRIVRGADGFASHVEPY